MSKQKIGILGLGLIGGSIEKALELYPNDFEVCSVSESQQRPYKLEDLQDADLIFLCGPQSQIPLQLEKIAQIIARSNQQAFTKTIITDVASTKSKIAQKALDLGLKNFIAGHPMAGTEKQCYENSFPELFQNATWILAESCPLLEKIIQDFLKAKPLIMDTQSHDASVAITSHLPLVISLSLANMLNTLPQIKQVMGPSIKEMLRLAKGNPELAFEIISLNRSNIKEAWNLFKSEMDAILEIKGSSLESEIVEIKEKLLQLV